MVKRFFSPQKSRKDKAMPDELPKKKRFGIWGKLPLAGKLLLAFGALFVFVVVVAAIILSGLNRTQSAYENTLAQGVEMRRLSNDLAINFSKARDEEKNFFLRWRTEGYETAYKNYVTVHGQYVASIHESLKQLAAFGPVAATVSTGGITQAQYEADIASLTQNVYAYEKSFHALVGDYKLKGSDEETDFEWQFKESAAKMEYYLFPGDPLEVDPLKVTYLQIRLNEKNYLTDAEQSYADKIHALIPIYTDQIKASANLTPAAKTDMLAQVTAYVYQFDRLVELDKEIAVYNKQLLSAADTAISLTAKIENLGNQLAEDRIDAARSNSAQTYTNTIIAVIAVLVLTILISITFSSQITRPIRALTNTAREISSGSFDMQANVSSGDEVGALAQAFNNMTAQLQGALQGLDRRAKEAESARADAEIASAAAKSAHKDIETQIWMATGQTQLADAMRGEQGISQLAENVISQLCQYMGAQAGALFLLNEKTLTLAGRYAFTKRPGFEDKFQLGEGLVGQAAMDGKVFHLQDIPSRTIVISTGLADVKPREVIAVPFYANGEVVGVIELATLSAFTQSHLGLLRRLSESIGVAFRTAETRNRLSELLAESQSQSEELQAQEEELRAANEELHAQAENLRTTREFKPRKDGA